VPRILDSGVGICAARRPTSCIAVNFYVVLRADQLTR
jgi:hypothetical protein